MTSQGDPLFVRTHGAAGHQLVVLHGGPAAAGHAAPLARKLAESFQVLEPWQRGSGDEPLTVARHIADLYEVIEAGCGDQAPALVGESWGAMLALAFATAHPDRVGPIVLVGCGTFDPQARAGLQARLDERTDDALRRRLEGLGEKISDPSERIRAMVALTRPLYLFDPIPTESEEELQFDVQAHLETWADMVRLQEEGVYPRTFSAITSPVLMLHGAYDPHPGALIRKSLEPYLQELEYREWERCGHSPWLERAVRDEFFDVMRAWLLDHIRFTGVQ